MESIPAIHSPMKRRCSLQESLGNARRSVNCAARDIRTLYNSGAISVTSASDLATRDNGDLGSFVFDFGGQVQGQRSSLCSSLRESLREAEEEVIGLTASLKKSSISEEASRKSGRRDDSISDGEDSAEADAAALQCQMAFLKSCLDIAGHLQRPSLDRLSVQPSFLHILLENAHCVNKAKNSLDQLSRSYYSINPSELILSDEERLANRSVVRGMKAHLNTKLSEVVLEARKILQNQMLFGDQQITVFEQSKMTSSGTSNTTRQSSKIATAFTALYTLALDSGSGGDPNSEIEQVLAELAHKFEVLCLSIINQEQNGMICKVSTRQLKEPSGSILDWSSESYNSELLEANQGCVDSDCTDNAWYRTISSITTLLTFVCQHILPISDSSEAENFVLKRFAYHLFGCLDDETIKWRPSIEECEKSVSIKSNTSAGGKLMKELHTFLWYCAPSTWEELSKSVPILEKATSGFVEFCVSMSLLTVESLHSLVEVTADIYRTFSEKKRTIVLSKGREILMEDYHNIKVVGKESNAWMSVSGVAPFADTRDCAAVSIFQLPMMAVSQVCLNLVSLAEDTLTETTVPSCPRKIGKVIITTHYRVVRELFDMFRSIIPSLHEHDILSSSRSAAVFHNDCVFLAHLLATLGLKYNNQLPEPLQAMFTFVDMVPSFRDLANKYLTQMVEKQKYLILKFLQDGGVIGLHTSLSTNKDYSVWTDADAAVRDVFCHLQHVCRSWQSILSSDVYFRVTGSLVDTIFSVVIDLPLKVDCICEAAVQPLCTLFKNILYMARELFAIVAKQSVIDVVQRSSELWDRIDAIAKFMDMSLSDIDSALSTGLFRSLTALELSHLINVTFDESDKRRRLLLVLSKSS